LGAILSLAGHLQTSDEGAQAVLPTGVGKTAVMCGLPFLIPTTRVLVVVPTRLLRDQVADEFRTLVTLRRVGAVPDDIERPNVRRVDHRLDSEEKWRELEACDIAVGTPAVLSAVHEGVAEQPEGLFDLLVFDEAHHLPATTWKGIHEQHSQRAALLTATPFRRDRKRLPGSLVYHYSLRQAIADQVYAPVTFVPVDALPGDDRAIAETAVARLRSSEHADEGSLLLVRTDRVEHAEQLVALYGDLGVSIGIITVRQSGRTVRRTIERLRSGELEGVASVGALVEGFDLPKLKIAAYHRPHKTLPPTLQFIGRIARITGGQAPAELIAVRQAVTEETAELYREDVAWAQILPQLVDAAVQRERETRHYLSEATTSGPEELSALALTPRRMCQVFETSASPTVDLSTDISRLPHGRIVFRFVDTDGVLLALVTERVVRPGWIESDVLDSYEYHLLLAVHDRERNLLFVSAPTVSAAARLRERIGAEDAAQISPQLVARYLWAATVASYSSVGMSSTRAAARQASYRMLAGSGVEAAISLTEVRGYGLGHVIGRRRDGGEQTGMGVSVKKSKIWEAAACESLLEFREWCDELGAAIRTEAAPTESVPHLQLRLPEPLEAFPDRPIAAFLDNRLIRGDTRLVVGETLVDCGSVQLVAQKVDDDQLRLRIGFDTGDLWVGVLQTDSSVTLETDELIVLTASGEREPLSDLVRDLPPTIYFANGTSVSGTILYEPLEELPPLPETVFAVWNWENTDTQNEDADTAGEGTVNIQERTLAFCSETLDDPIVIIDHGSYEIADVVAIERGDDRHRVHLFHCKASSEAAPGRRLQDIYEVLGQGIRSARWSGPAAVWGELERRVRERPQLQVIDRDKAEVQALLAEWRDDPPDVDLHVWVVQPGLSQAAVEGWPEGQSLIANAYDWCHDMPAELTLAVSP
ncbi:MAG: DEAD/DEAH box helicase family protein, partial [Thermoleophilaceae bacterium]